MAQVYPFPALRYNAGKVSYDRVLTQPYDKISPAMQDKYYAADPHNLITIEKGRVLPGDTPAGVPEEKNVYTRAAAALENWIREQVVVPDTRPCFYSYTQEYTVPGTQWKRAPPHAPRLHRRRQARGILRRRRLPPRAHPLRPQSRPPRTPPPHANAHRPALPALQRP